MAKGEFGATGGCRELADVNGVGGWTSREVLDQHDVGLHLIHLQVDDPSAIGQSGEARTASEKRLLYTMIFDDG